MKWISVKDQLPEKGVNILVYGIKECYKEYDVFIAFFQEVHNFKEGINISETLEYWEAETGYDITDVTHWMPLPTQPEIV